MRTGIFSIPIVAATMFAIAAFNPAHAACGAAHQRMQVGTLPDLFLNYIRETEVELNAPRSDGRFPPVQPRLPRGARTLPLRLPVREKTVPYHWTGNDDLVNGDCDVWAFFTMAGVGAANTYNPGCIGHPERCPVVMYPEATTVGPAIAENVVKQFPLRIVAAPDTEPQKVGAVMLIGLDCQGDICEPPLCLRQNTRDEFYERPDPTCTDFDANAAGWRSGGQGYGNAYLIGRGNLYVGPYVQPAFEVSAASDTDFLKIDHWIVNGRNDAVIIVTAKGRQTADTKYFGVKFRQADRSWGVVAERDGGIIPAGSRFNVYVMGDMGNNGPGYTVRSLDGQSEFAIDDPLLDRNPNGVAFVTHIVARACTIPEESGPLENLLGGIPVIGDRIRHEPQCVDGYFPHPVGVRYDPGAGKWKIVSLDGTAFPPQVAFNVFASGLAGTYHEPYWISGQTPQYAHRLETVGAAPSGSTTALMTFDGEDGEALVFATQNLSPYDRRSTPDRRDLHPIGVDFIDGAWRVVNLDGAAMSETSFNVVTPLKAP